MKEEQGNQLSRESYSLRILPLQQLRNRLQLDIARPLIDGPDLAIAKHLLRNPLPHEAHPAHPLDRLPADPARHLRRIQLRHRGVAHKILAGFLLARRVVDERAGGADLRVGLRELVLHALELADQLAELFAVFPDVAAAACQPSRSKMRKKEDLGVGG